MKDAVIKALSFLQTDKETLQRLVEVPKDHTKGDYALPCFSLTKQLRKDPKQIAQDIATTLETNKTFESVQAVGPYVNFFVDRATLAEEVISRISQEKDAYGKSVQSKETVMVEFSQPNTHKAFHVGHIRGTSLGESLARIMDYCGNSVIRANYSGDTGMHIAKWLWCYLNYHKNEEIRDDEAWFAHIYVEAIQRLAKDESLQEAVDEINRKLYSREDKELNALWKKTRKQSIAAWKRIYHELNTTFDVHYFESDVEARGKEIAQRLVKKEIANISDGATIMDLKDVGLSVWVLLRSDGTVLYSAKDIALAEQKFKEFKLNRSLVITDSAQDLHFRQLQKTLELMKFPKHAQYTHNSYGSIRFPWGKMSSRTGDNVLYSDFKKQLVDIALKEIEKRYKLESTEVYDRALAISIASMKYAMLKQDTNKNIIFNPKEAVSFEGDTGPYLLYSYARAQSILRKAEYKRRKQYTLGTITDEEKRLASELGRFPDVVIHAYEHLAPNTIATYTYGLAKTFSDFYHACPVIGSETEQFRLKLVDCFAQTIKNALFLLGITVIPEM